MSDFEASTHEDLLALEDALECAYKHTEQELARKRSAPYARALEAQKSRYEALAIRVRIALGEKQ